LAYTVYATYMLNVNVLCLSVGSAVRRAADSRSSVGFEAVDVMTVSDGLACSTTAGIDAVAMRTRLGSAAA